MKKITNAGNMLIRITTAVAAALFLLYGALMLWDMYRTQIHAFASYDLLKYRPNIEEDEPPYLDDLLEINPDTAAWITIYNTNIDYPVMHGEKDSDYINKDVYGSYSVSGSIFMASQNAKDFSDPYTLVYGHHLENGSMFGDIMKFKDREFFDKNDTGVLIMENMVYDLKIMGVLETSAYDRMVYRTDKTEAEAEEFYEYAKRNCMYWRDKKHEKILALSTCDSATTSGRSLLICAMTKRTKPLPDREYGEPIPHREAIGHPMTGAYWSFLNLIALLATIYALARIVKVRRRNLMRLSVLIETGLTAISALLFILTEDLHRPIQMVDAWTPFMVLIPAVMWLVERQTQKADSAKDPGNETHSEQSN